MSTSTTTKHDPLYSHYLIQVWKCKRDESKTTLTVCSSKVNKTTVITIRRRGEANKSDIVLEVTTTTTYYCHCKELTLQLTCPWLGHEKLLLRMDLDHTCHLHTKQNVSIPEKEVLSGTHELTLCKKTFPQKRFCWLVNWLANKLSVF